jgi:branched-chain amino acid transport system permease protein
MLGALPSPRPGEMTKHVVALGVPVAIIVLLALAAPAVGGPGTQLTTVGALINLIVVVGIYIFVGNSGILSFGHISFMSIGAYCCALLTVPPLIKHVFYPDFPQGFRFMLEWQLNPIAAGLVAAAAAAVFALIAGVPLMRLGGFQSGIATLSVLISVNVVIANWDSVTHGTSTVIGVPPYSTVATTLAVAVGAICVAYLYQTSGRGLRLRAVREDLYAAQALGINFVVERWIAFGLSAFVVGAGGVMYAFFIPFASSDFYLAQTFFAIAILVIGGRNSLWGAVLGTIVVTVITDVIRRFEAGIPIEGTTQLSLPGGSTEVGLGLAMLLMLLLRPNGLTGGKEVAVEPVLRAISNAKDGMLRRRTREAHSPDRVVDAELDDTQVKAGEE